MLKKGHQQTPPNTPEDPIVESRGVTPMVSDTPSGALGCRAAVLFPVELCTTV